MYMKYNINRVTTMEQFVKSYPEPAFRLVKCVSMRTVTGLLGIFLGTILYELENIFLI